jgi:hypothetical protein
MRKARNADGSCIFETTDYLTHQQISSFFSRLARKRRAACNDIDTEEEDEDEDEDDIIEKLNEENIQELTDEIMNEISITHPIMFETHNICELATNSKLSKFSVQMLHDICSYYQLETSTIKRKRKKPYIDLLNGLVESCSCNKKL